VFGNWKRCVIHAGRTDNKTFPGVKQQGGLNKSTTKSKIIHHNIHKNKPKYIYSGEFELLEYEIGE
jgi:hypothetical protein